jgi:hypothetical protein
MRLLSYTRTLRNARHNILEEEAPDPGPSALKRCWVIVPGRHLIFTPSGRDVLVQMKRGGVATATSAGRAA